MRSLVRRPRHVLRVHDRLGRADEDRGPLELTARRRDRREAAEHEGGHELPAGPSFNLECLAGERVGVIEVAELTLDHAEVRRLGRDQELVVGRADERQALAHPLAGFEQVAVDLRADAEQVKGIRSTRLVAGRVTDGQCFTGQSATLGHIRPQGHAGETAERLRDERRVVEAPAVSRASPKSTDARASSPIQNGMNPPNSKARPRSSGSPPGSARTRPNAASPSSNRCLVSQNRYSAFTRRRASSICPARRRVDRRETSPERSSTRSK